MADSNPRREFARKQKQFLDSQRDSGQGKEIKRVLDKKRPTPREIAITKALISDNTSFFNAIMDDRTEQALWMRFLEGRIPELDGDGELVRDKYGAVVYHEITGVSWNAFRRMVEYKRGMPVIKVDDNAGKPVTVNFNIMGASSEQMHEKVKELGLLPLSTSTD